MLRLLKVSILLPGIFFFGCENSADVVAEQQPVMQLIPSNLSGIKFSNTIIENDTVNVLDYEYCYNGGGVGVGDFNNDGLEDLFFTGNQVGNALYINKGDLKFEDQTAISGTNGPGWATGVTIVDINNDHYDDIFVSYSGMVPDKLRRNRFYINQRNGTFIDESVERGLIDEDFSTHAAFFDFDRDGDLDLFVINHHNSFGDKRIAPADSSGNAISNDRLYENVNGKFTDISKRAGIKYEGYSLGLGIEDINSDGWLDILVTNDYYFDDYIYINQRDGSFKESSKRYFKHTSNFSMGNDFGDINNDGVADIMVLDMLPEDQYRRQKLVGPLNLELFFTTLKSGYNQQFMRNNLQLGSRGTSYSEIGQLAGVYATDWSWSPLFLDIDNSGNQDLFISNGFRRDITDRNFIVYRMKQEMLRTPEARQNLIKALSDLDGAKLKNFFYENTGDLKFKDRRDEWAESPESYSNGAAYADLNNDGTLELIVSNIGEEVFLYKNVAESNYAILNLDREGVNLGARAMLYTSEGVQYRRLNPYRGFQSTVTNRLHFGLGKIETIDSIEVIWLDGMMEVKKKLKSNQVITFKGKLLNEKRSEEKRTFFTQLNDSLDIHYEHSELESIDFKSDPLLPHMFSKMGPGMAVGDVTGDGLEDIIIGGSSGKKATKLVQNLNGTFSSQEIIDEDFFREDMGIALFDSDGDDDLDLYIVSGGNDVKGEDSYYQDRFYVNNGKGDFTHLKESLPKMNQSGGVVRPFDFDKDGDVDLFIGGRLAPGFYPYPSTSYVLENIGENSFQFLEGEVDGPLHRLGMVTDAVWTDFNRDGWFDLIVVGEWMPVTFIENRQGDFIDVTEQKIEKHSNGWWNSITSGDFDADGDIDYILGNLGDNNQYHPSIEEPVEIFAKDFDSNGKVDPIITQYIQGKRYSKFSLDVLVDQLKIMRKKFPNYEKFALTTFDDYFTPEELKGVYHLEAFTFSNSYMENLGNNNFDIKPLHSSLQIAPIFGATPLFLNDDEYLDLLAIGNQYSSDVIAGRNDAGKGYVLLGNGDGSFEALENDISGVAISGDAKSLVQMSTRMGEVYLAAQNTGPLLAYGITTRQNKEVDVPKETVRYKIFWENGRVIYGEVGSGGYLSQSTRKLYVPGGTDKVELINTNEEVTIIEF